MNTLTLNSHGVLQFPIGFALKITWTVKCYEPTSTPEASTVVLAQAYVKFGVQVWYVAIFTFWFKLSKRAKTVDSSSFFHIVCDDWSHLIKTQVKTVIIVCSTGIRSHLVKTDKSERCVPQICPLASCWVHFWGGLL